MTLGYDGFLPTTAHAAVEILQALRHRARRPARVVVGRSNVVGKPAALLLMREHATVTVCHSKTTDLARHVKDAEIVVVAAGHPGLITGQMLRKGAVVVDVGINVVDDRIVGDVDFDSASKVASAITPVPGGVGPVTNALLLTHLVRAAQDQAQAGGARASTGSCSPPGVDHDLHRPVPVRPRDRPRGDAPADRRGRGGTSASRPTRSSRTATRRRRSRIEGIRRLEAANPRGKYVVVTGMTPTPLGEGKSTTVVGLAQGLNRIGRRAAVTIRQPSLGPVFGIKGGAAGGGHSQVIPMEDFNLHLTGDVHAIGAAHNLAAAFIDNHVHHGNELAIDQNRILWPRVVDISDRALREVVVGLGGAENGYARATQYVITVGSEVMAILALASDIHDLRARLGRIVLATRRDGTPITAEDLKVAGSMTVLLKDAIKPNLLQTLEGGPAFVHCGPFANIAHGNNSVLADRLALATTDIVVHRGGLRGGHGRREVLRHQVPRVGAPAGRGRRRRHDPRAQDARRRRPDRRRQAARPGAAREQPGRGAGRRRQPREADRERARRTACRSVVAINTFPTDTPAEIEAVREVALAAGARDAVVARHFTDGGAGAEDLAQAVWAAAEEGAPDFRLLYPDEAPLADKIETIATRDLRRRRGRLPAGGEAPARAVRGHGLRQPADLHGQDAVQPVRQPEAAGTADRFPRPDPRDPPRGGGGLHHADRGRDADHAGTQQRGRAASASTSTPTGTSSGCSDRPSPTARRASGAEREARRDHEPRGHDHADHEAGPPTPHIRQSIGPSPIGACP